MTDTEIDRPDFAVETRRAARKEHVCNFCDVPIRVGQVYDRIVMGGDNGVQTYKRHTGGDCSELTEPEPEDDPRDQIDVPIGAAPKMDEHSHGCPTTTVRPFDCDYCQERSKSMSGEPPNYQ